MITSRRRLVVAAVVLLVLTGALLAVIDPFGDASGASSDVDNGSATALATVHRRSLSAREEVTGRLGYSGTYEVIVPVGTPGATLAEDQAAGKQAHAKVAADQQALARAQLTAQAAAPATTAQADLTSATKALAAAQRQLTADRRLGCPPASPSTVTSPNTPSSSASGDGGGTQVGSAESHAGTADITTGPPGVITGTARATTAGAVLSGVVNPRGLATTYYFRYGTSSRLGHRSDVAQAGAGTAPLDVTGSVTGLAADTTYGFQLVATNAAGTTSGAVQTLRTGQSSCAVQQEVVAADRSAVAAAQANLAATQASGGEAVAQAQEQLAADQAIADADDQALAQAQLHASTGSNSTSAALTVTALPEPGVVVHRGQGVYHLDGSAVPLFYGSTIPWRALSVGVADGPDVTQLERNLVALGFEHGGIPDAHFDGVTAAAVRRWQHSLGEPQTGVVNLGAVVVEPGPIRIVTVTATLGQPVQPGAAILSASSTAREVTVDLDATQQSEVKAGDQVIITLPDNSTTPGVVTSVGAVATEPASSGQGAAPSGESSASGSTQTPTITVYIAPSKPQDTGNLDQAPVTVAITTATVRDALVVPVTALLALSGGGYALEVVPRSGPHHLVAVRLGLFDDADGLVQVVGAAVQAGQRVVVPAKP